MAAVWMRARSELRARWRSLVALGMLVGLFGGVALAAAAGARRTVSAYERLEDLTRWHDVQVDWLGSGDVDVLERARTVPGVAASGRVSLFPSTAAVSDPEFKWDLDAAAIVDGVGEDIAVPVVVAGRRMDFADPAEAMVNETFVEQRGLGVGDTLSFQTITYPAMLELFDGRLPRPDGPRATVLITGVWKAPHDFAFEGDDRGLLYLSPAFYRRFTGRAAQLDLLFVRLEGGARGVEGFVRRARALTQGSDELGFTPSSQTDAKVQRALDVSAGWLWVFVGVIGIATVMILGQAIARAIAVGADEQPVLGAIGMSRGQRFGIALAPAAVAAIVGGAVSVGVALLMSSTPPFGFAGEIEPSPGLRADWLVLLIGSVGVAVGILLRAFPSAALAAGRGSRDAEVRARAGRAADRAARTGFPATVVTGVRFALEPGRGRSAVPVRSGLVGGIVAIVAVSGAITFAGSLDRLADTPALYGWNWDLQGFGGEDPETVDAAQRTLTRSPLVRELARISVHSAEFEGVDLHVVGLEHVRGGILPTMLEGRFPRSPSEVALGTTVLRDRQIRLGDRVSFPGTKEACDGRAECRIDFTVVGRAIFWAEDAPPGEGAAFTMDGVRRVRRTEGFDDFVIRVASGIDPQTAVERISAEIGDATLPEMPIDVENMARERTMPYALAVMLGLLALATVAHVLVMSVRHRGRDLAILKTLGFVRRQVRAIVAWQSTVTMVIVALVGVPLGIAVGRGAWQLSASRLGVVPDPAAPALALAIGALGLVALANLIALVPARAAARTEPALVLRTE